MCLEWITKNIIHLQGSLHSVTGLWYTQFPLSFECPVPLFLDLIFLTYSGFPSPSLISLSVTVLSLSLYFNSHGVSLCLSVPTRLNLCVWAWWAEQSPSPGCHLLPSPPFTGCSFPDTSARLREKQRHTGKDTYCRLFRGLRRQNGDGDTEQVLQINISARWLDGIWCICGRGGFRWAESAWDWLFVSPQMLIDWSHGVFYPAGRERTWVY